MSMNNQDDKLLRKIERLIDNGLPVNDDLLNDLATHQPAATRDHVERLEARLMGIAYEQHHNKETNNMQLSIREKNKSGRRRFTIPATFAAVLALLILGGAVLFFMLPRGTNPGQFLGFGDPQEQDDAAATPLPPTVDPFAMTATRIVDNATASAVPAQGLNITATPMATATFLPTATSALAFTVPQITVRLMGDNVVLQDQLSGVEAGQDVNVFAVILQADYAGVSSLNAAAVGQLAERINDVDTPIVTRNSSATVNRITSGVDGELQFIELGLHPEDAAIIEWLISSGVPLVVMPE